MRGSVRPMARIARAAHSPELRIACSSPCALPSLRASIRQFAIRDNANTGPTGSSGNGNAAGAGDVKGKIRESNGDRAYDPYAKVRETHPIIQLPARTLWMQQYGLNPRLVANGEYSEMIQRVKDARHYYQYPSLCGPQIGWNVQMFTLFDGSVFINPVDLDREAWRQRVIQQHAARARQAMGGSSKTEEAPLAVRHPPDSIDWFDQEERHIARLRQSGKTGFAWEPCASCCFLMHYIERPGTARIRALDESGDERVHELTGMRARFALHELDHLHGVLFTRRVVDTDHVVPLDGFNSMSDWSDDYPSLEARSTFLYTTFTPPYTFRSESVDDANLLNRKFDDGIYPGCERDRQMRIQTVAFQSLQRDRWRRDGDKGGPHATPAEREAEAAQAAEKNEKDGTE